MLSSRRCCHNMTLVMVLLSTMEANAHNTMKVGLLASKAIGLFNGLRQFFVSSFGQKEAKDHGH